MGNLYIHYLLTHQSSKWKKKYVKSFISLAGPWGGAVKSIRLEISGNCYFIITLFADVLDVEIKIAETAVVVCQK